MHPSFVLQRRKGQSSGQVLLLPAAPTHLVTCNFKLEPGEATDCKVQTCYMLMSLAALLALQNTCYTTKDACAWCTPSFGNGGKMGVCGTNYQDDEWINKGNKPTVR